MSPRSTDTQESQQLKGPAIVFELRYLLDLLTLCWHFSKKLFPVFLKETDYSQEDVLIQKPKARILKPAFTILVNHKTKMFLLLIRGTHSIKDTLTAATGEVVPFHHIVVHEGGVTDVKLGYAHCGMVAVARWIAKLAIPLLLKAFQDHHDYKLQIVGHSLGGGTAAILTYVLREQKELSTTTCVTFAPGACMTWELADSGNDFITSVINGADLVPTFSAASVDDLRAEVTASAWLNDLRTQIEHTRILRTVYRSASALDSRLPSIASAKAKVAGAGEILRPVSSGTQGPRQRPVVTNANSPESSSSNTEAQSISTALELLVSSSDETMKVRRLMWQKEMGEEEEAAIAEESNTPETKESYRFFPAGKIMHLVTIPQVVTESESSSSDSDNDRDRDQDQDHVTEDKVGIFLTSRSLYSKIRLSHNMIADHFMPVYRRQIEKLIQELEKEETSLKSHMEGSVILTVWDLMDDGSVFLITVLPTWEPALSTKRVVVGRHLVGGSAAWMSSWGFLPANEARGWR
ncbi:mono-/di-acylglycerol lipase class 3 [Tanacetum coccineum]|uniref:Mono-/di-acylglycerol lipase class 3 n=1 Tax=Tanacetum coccineum TaxID=301880 RepID=A0ABQ5AGE6_9ASTR